MLLLTKEGIACRPYHEEFEEVTWEKCSLRSWLNGEFLNGFTDEERAMILKTRVKNLDNPDYDTPGGNDTEDLAFLLSIEEARHFFKNDENRICIPGKEAIEEGVFVAGGACLWWLRSPGGSRGSAACVYAGGFVSSPGFIVYPFSYGVRPALWVNLES